MRAAASDGSDALLEEPSLGLDQGAGRPLPAGRWLLVAGTCMDAWPVLKLTPGAKAQRS